MSTQNDGGRHTIVEALRAELFGPPANTQNPVGRPVSFRDALVFQSRQDSHGPFHEAGTGNEVLVRDRPTKRYGVGVLYPHEQPQADANEGEAETVIVGADDDRPSDPVPETHFSNSGRAEADDDDFDLSATSQYRPSAMAVSLLAELEADDLIEVVVTGGRYESQRVRVEDQDRQWFVRRPVVQTVHFAAPTSAGKQRPTPVPDFEPLALGVEILARTRGDQWLLTVALTNNAPGHLSAENNSLFQADFTVSIRRGGDIVEAIVPYPDPRSERLLQRDEESRSLDLMYRNAPTFGVGHGCAATWSEKWGTLRSKSVRATALPAFETPSVTPDIVLGDDRQLSVPMGPLAGLDADDDGFASVATVADEYGTWIKRLEAEANSLDGFRLQAAEDHIGKCWRAHRRIVDGIEWLSTDTTARRAFMLANRAILEQQINFRAESRTTTLTRDGPVVEAGTPVKDWRDANRSWRAFQIGFLVAAARSAAEGDHDDREAVELIFFPTGGGKTEAYLGLAAFVLFYQRLTGRNTGVSVLMRYTLRLLTSQQFLRASALVCAMELIRKDSDDLGEQRFTIGIWVGGSTTPNNRQGAVASYNALAKGQTKENPFLVLRCPWCAAQMGAIDAAKGVKADVPRIAGYRSVAGSVEFRCPDRRCPFRKSLPIFVIDDDLYEERPSIVIGTVDKFAMLAYRPEARKLFGLDELSVRVCDPPSLIIQDELHLISGPLGSMVGLYEPIIERLCTRTENGESYRPKIVGSTATIRNYAEQICGLYGRTDAALFPPHGLDAADSFFARHARDPETGELSQGRMYVGVHGPGLGSIQTAQVRTGSALLQAPMSLPVEQRDAWWSSLMFFNSIRELGTSVSLLQSDIPDYLYAMKLRSGATEQRYINELMELTSRLRQDEIPGAIARLERTLETKRAIDVCLASNIIEVGVDIQRLSLLTVLGQPKSTSQYIQITGRVGRNWQERPGLVVTIYSPLRPRDRSHFEKFQAHHQRLYAEVEPVSVTPFSSPVLRRAAHAVAISYIRQTSWEGIGPSPVPLDQFDEVERLLIERAEIADPESVPDVKRELERRRTQWTGWEPVHWEGDDGPLMRRAGEWIDDDLRDVTWPVPMSLRDVDADCRCAITNRYAIQRGDDDAGNEGTDS